MRNARASRTVTLDYTAVTDRADTVPVSSGRAASCPARAPYPADLKASDPAASAVASPVVESFRAGCPEESLACRASIREG